MVFGGAKPRVRIGKRIQDSKKSEAEIYSLIRRSDTVTGAGVPFTGAIGGSGSSGQSDSGFLPTGGGTMIGPIAFFPVLITIASDTIDIGKATDSFSSRVILTSQSGTTDDLVTISNAAHAGQLLILQPIATHTITIKTTGNIRSGTGADIVLNPQDNILMVFDSIANEWTNLAPVNDTAGGAASALGSLSDVTITGAVKGDILVYNGTAWVDLTVGTDGFFLKALASETTGLEWASSSATEVPVWTQDHDSDGYDLLIDTDGDSKWVMDRDAGISDDELGLILGPSSTQVHYFFSRSATVTTLSILDEVDGDALQLSISGTKAIINSTAYDIDVAGTTIFTIKSDGLVFSQGIDMNGLAAGIVFDADGDSLIFANTDDNIQITTGGSVRVAVANAQTTFSHNILMLSADVDLDANTLIIDLDGDTSISSAVDDTVLFKTGGTTRATLTNSNLLMAVDVDLNGTETLIMDADADSTIFANSDDNIQFSTGGSVRAALSNTTYTFEVPFDMQGNDILDGGIIKLREQAEADGDTPGAGQIWVDTQTPNKLFFTDDAGTDHDLLAAGSGITFPVTPTIKDHSTTWTNNVAIDLALTTAHIQKITLDANLIWATPSNPPSSGTQIEFEIEYVQDATGGWTVNQWAEVV